MLTENLSINNSDYISFYINDSVVEVLASQAEELRLLPGVDGNWVQINLDDDSGEGTTLTTSILEAMRRINLEEEGIPEDGLSACISRFERAYEIIDSINQSKPNNSYDFYKDGTGSFEDETFLYDLRKYLTAVENFKTDLSGAFQSSPFSVFLSLRPDIISSEYNVFTNVEAYAEFLNRYKIEASFNSLTYALSGLNVNVIQKIVSDDFDTIEDDLAFSISEGLSNFKNVPSIKNTSDDYIKSNHSDGSVDAIKFSYNI